MRRYNALEEMAASLSIGMSVFILTLAYSVFYVNVAATPPPSPDPASFLASPMKDPWDNDEWNPPLLL